MSETYKMKTLLAVTKLSRSKLDTWLFKELITPAVPAKGSGYSSEYSLENIVQLMIIDRLARAGVKLAVAATIARRCMENQDRHCYVDVENPERDFTFLKPNQPPSDVDFCLIIRTKDIIQGVWENIRDGVEEK